jgi:hypothetical protein
VTQRAGPGIALLCLAGALLLAAAAHRGAHPDRPPVAHTGGFGEPTCHACHFDAPPGSGPGGLTATGVPRQLRPGARYAIQLQLVQQHLKAAGFQLSARYEDGTQAGVFTVVPDEHERVAVTPLDGTLYAHHLLDGTSLTAPDTARWTIVWQAPPHAPGTVTFHAAAVAADGDLSPLGDFVYTLAARSGPAPDL